MTEAEIAQIQSMIDSSISSAISGAISTEAVTTAVANYLNENGGVTEDLTEATDTDIEDGNITFFPVLNSETETYVKVPLSYFQKLLVSGQNIKTINGTSLLGPGNLVISGGGGGGSIDVDTAMSGTSTNPVQNRVITAALADKMEGMTESEFNEIFD